MPGQPNRKYARTSYEQDENSDEGHGESSSSGKNQNPSSVSSSVTSVTKYDSPSNPESSSPTRSDDTPTPTNGSQSGSGSDNMPESGKFPDEHEDEKFNLPLKRYQQNSFWGHFSLSFIPESIVNEAQDDLEVNVTSHVTKLFPRAAIVKGLITGASFSSYMLSHLSLGLPSVAVIASGVTALIEFTKSVVNAWKEASRQYNQNKTQRFWPTFFQGIVKRVPQIIEKSLKRGVKFSCAYMGWALGMALLTKLLGVTIVAAGLFSGPSALIILGAAVMTFVGFLVGTLAVDWVYPKFKAYLQEKGYLDKLKDYLYSFKAKSETWGNTNSSNCKDPPKQESPNGVQNAKQLANDQQQSGNQQKANKSRQKARKKASTKSPPRGLKANILYAKCRGLTEGSLWSFAELSSMYQMIGWVGDMFFVSEVVSLAYLIGGTVYNMGRLLCYGSGQAPFRNMKSTYDKANTTEHQDQQQIPANDNDMNSKATSNDCVLNTEDDNKNNASNTVNSFEHYNLRDFFQNKQLIINAYSDIKNNRSIPDIFSNLGLTKPNQKTWSRVYELFKWRLLALHVRNEIDGPQVQHANECDQQPSDEPNSAFQNGRVYNEQYRGYDADAVESKEQQHNRPSDNSHVENIETLCGYFAPKESFWLNKPETLKVYQALNTANADNNHQTKKSSGTDSLLRKIKSRQRTLEKRLFGETLSDEPQNDRKKVCTT